MAEDERPNEKTVQSTGTYDIILRYLTSRYAEQLVRPYVAEGGVEGVEALEVEGLPDTQLAARERRLDRNVRLRYGDRQEVLHIEFQLERRADLDYRVFEYHAMLAMALHNPKTQAAAPIRSVVVLLQGPQGESPGRGEYGTLGLTFHYAIDPIYAMTIDDLEARGEPLWMAFAPLTVDASESTLRGVLRHLDALGLDAPQLADLKASMVILAKADRRKRGLRDVLKELITREEMMSSPMLDDPWLESILDLKAEKMAEERVEKMVAERVEKMAEERVEKMVEERAEKVAEERVERAEQEGLLRVLRRRLGRAESDSERDAFSRRFGALGPEAVLDVILEGTSEELVVWLGDGEG